MARKYSGKKGKSGSKKPVRKVVPAWVKLKAAEVTKLVVKYAKEGKTCAEIGIILRDSYGIPSVKTLTGKKIYELVKENNCAKELPEDLQALLVRAAALVKHLSTNKKDFTAKRGLQLTESRIKALEKYYKKTKVLPKNWTYVSEFEK